jgi:putative DNA primase/helicase
MWGGAPAKRLMAAARGKASGRAKAKPKAKAVKAGRRADAAEADKAPLPVAEPSPATAAPRNADPPQDGPRDTHRLANYFLREADLKNPPPSFRLWHDEWWAWNGRCYKRLSTTDLRARVTRSVRAQLEASREQLASKDGDSKGSFNANVTRTLVSNVFLAIESLRNVPSSVEQPAWLDGVAEHRSDYFAVANGLVDLEAAMRGGNALRAHTPAWFSPTCSTYAFDATATCPMFCGFLAEVLENDADRISLVQQWFGYCLALGLHQEKFMVLVGEGGDGKSVLLNLLVSLLGEQNVSHVPLELFGERFHLTETLGKLANVVTEIGEADGRAEGLLKAFVSGDPMFFDRKNLPGISARPTARLVFSTNSLPIFRDRSAGIYRRLLIIPFNLALPEHRQDTRLLARLKTELPGILNWTIAGRRSLLERGRFVEPSVCVDAREGLRTQANPARAYLLDVVVADPCGDLVAADLWRGFKQWCELNGYRSLNAAQMGHEVRRVFGKIERKRVQRLDGEGRAWAYAGIRWRTNED